MKIDELLHLSRGQHQARVKQRMQSGTWTVIKNPSQRARSPLMTKLITLWIHLHGWGLSGKIMILPCFNKQMSIQIPKSFRRFNISPAAKLTIGRETVQEAGIRTKLFEKILIGSRNIAFIRLSNLNWQPSHTSCRWVAPRSQVEPRPSQKPARTKLTIFKSFKI